MHSINDLNYPLLRYHGYPNMAEHTDFNGLYRKLSLRETMNIVIQHPDDPIIKSCSKLPDAYAPVKDIDPTFLRSFPVFRIPETDIPTTGTEQVEMLWYGFTHFWELMYHDKNPEIVKGSDWDEMFYKTPDGFDQWLEAKVDSGYMQSGVIIRPHEEVCSCYSIMYNADEWMEISYCFRGRELLWGHIGPYGFLSKTIEMPEAIMTIAKEREVTPQQALFQEDMYNILLWLFFKERYRMERKVLPAGTEIRDKEGYTDFRIATDTQCVIYGKPVIS